MDKIKLFSREKDCSGCGACAVVCPKQAITMTEDACGYLYPVIDTEKCIRCGKCQQSCGHGNSILQEPLLAFAAVGKQEEIVKNSTSGGVFATLAYQAVAQGWLTAGAVMDMGEKGAQVYHMLSGNGADIPRMQGSKYVQSNGYLCYQDVCRAVREGKNVLFSGTPCQVAAVKRLTGDPDNLLTVDIICHGVPPVRLMNDFLTVIGKRLGGKITDFTFRDKSAPKPFTARLQVKKGKKCWDYRMRAHFLSFYQHFLQGMTYRESCYHCPYAGMKRASDLTIGDYWQIEKHHKSDIDSGEMPNRKDWSCILVNTEKGRAFLEQCGQALLRIPTDKQWIAESNQQLRQPSLKNPKREKILGMYQAEGYRAVERMFIRDQGGRLRFFWRMLKTVTRNCYED